jgi:carboxylate-amine ligase
VPEPASWWWELRLHALHGTVEVRVCDAQTTLVEAGALAAVIHCVVADLAARHAAGEAMPTPPSWRVEESRWSAGRHGLDASFADPVTGTVEPVRERLARRLDALAATAERLGCAHELTDAHALLQAGCGAERQRAVFAEVGAVGLARWLTDRFVGRFAPGATEGATRSAAVPRG